MGTEQRELKKLLDKIMARHKQLSEQLSPLIKNKDDLVALLDVVDTKADEAAAIKSQVDELKGRIEQRLFQEGKVREGERGLLADNDTYLEDLNGLYEEFFPRYAGNKLWIESKDWKLVNDDGSIRYDSEEADKLLNVIREALEQKPTEPIS